MTSSRTIASARAHSNIAFIKYWGNRNQQLRLPSNSSLSMNLSDLYTTTQVRWSRDLANDTLTINRAPASDDALRRASDHLAALRRRFGTNLFAQVESHNNFPMGAGIASSASAFAALTVAAAAALGEALPERELTTLARLGSGSAARSIPAGFVEWHGGDTHEASYAETFVAVDHWPLVDVIAIVSRAHKRIGSTAGHASADSSILQRTRVESVPARLDNLKQAIVLRDFDSFANIVEEDSNLMHAVMMTSKPPLFYWQPLSLKIMEAVRLWRTRDGIQACYTLDAGPNVHCICAEKDAAVVAARLQALSTEIEIMPSTVGGGAVLVTNESTRTEAGLRCAAKAPYNVTISNPNQR